MFTPVCARLADQLPSSESRVSATHLAMGVPGLCYQIQWYMGSGDSDSTPTMKQVLSPLSSSSGLYSFLEALGKTFFLACSRLWGELGSYGCMIGFPFPFLLRVAPSFWRLRTVSGLWPSLSSLDRMYLCVDVCVRGQWRLIHWSSSYRWL